MITLTVFLPAITALVLLLLPTGKGGAADRSLRAVALFGSLVTFGLAIALLIGFDRASGEFQMVEEHSWVPSLGVAFKVGIDGISLFLVVLTALLTPIAILCSWTSISKGVRGFHIATLVLETGMLGVLVSLDLVLFYVFWEVMLLPIYLMVGVWGSGDRVMAAVKLFIYTMVGSLLMLLAILYVWFHLDAAGAATMDIRELYTALRAHPLSATEQFWCFLAFGLSFAIKVPLFPFHTWLPDAHTEAPTAGSVILAGVLLKMGAYGFIRLAMPFFPEAAAELAPFISVLAVISIIFGALMCFVQDDIKRLIAYSSVSHMGFVMLGIFSLWTRDAVGVTGGVLQMINHGISTGALFLLVGAIYERRHTRKIEDYGGIATRVPLLATVFMITTLSSIGLPFLNGFVGEFLILQGAYKQHVAWAGFAGSGVILGAIYMLVLYRRVFLGKSENKANDSMTDLNGRELGFFAPLIALMVLIGLFSPWFTEAIGPSVQSWMDLVAGSGR